MEGGWQMWVLFVAGIATTGCREGGSPSGDGKPPALAAKLPNPDRPNPVQAISEKTTLRDAIEFARPLMTDTQNETSPGGALLAQWAIKRLTWQDLNSVGETKFSLVKKDSETYRGQRICRQGNVIQISVDKTEAGKLYTGIFMTTDRDIATFLAVKSTGELVERSWARFCGIVVGNNSYSNAAGGTSHAVNLVGMFDLPENRL